MNRQIIPTAALLAGATLWGVVWYPMRLLESAGLNGLWLSMLIYGFAAAATLPILWRDRAWCARRPWALLGIGLTVGITNIAFILAVLEGNIVRVLLLFYLSPVWAVWLAIVFLGERLGRAALAVLALAFLGALMMLWHPEVGLPVPASRADWLALVSGFAFACSNVLIRHGEDIPVRLKSWSAWAGGALLAGGLILILDPMTALAPKLLYGAAALGILGMTLMTLLVQYGVSHMPVQRSAVILLFEIVAGAISQQLLTNETMTMIEWGGGILVVTAAFITAVRVARE